jgi:hypothetical protein
MAADRHTDDFSREAARQPDEVSRALCALHFHGCGLLDKLIPAAAID